MTRLRSSALALIAMLWVVAMPAYASEIDSKSEVESNIESDPLEGMNRRLFWFNDRLDVYIIEPVGKGWRWISPQSVRTSLSKFFLNLRFPVRFVSNLIEFNAVGAGEELGRFSVNTTVGILGFFDPATGWGLEGTDTDVGLALGRWGMPPGPYLILPIFGPSNPRDTLGLIGDTVLSSGPSLISPAVGAIVNGGELINLRAELVPVIDDAKEASFDYYVFVRNAYAQNRRARVLSENPDEAEPIEDDLYEIYDDE